MRDQGDGYPVMVWNWDALLWLAYGVAFCSGFWALVLHFVLKAVRHAV